MLQREGKGLKRNVASGIWNVGTWAGTSFTMLQTMLQGYRYPMKRFLSLSPPAGTALKPFLSVPPPSLPRPLRHASPLGWASLAPRAMPALSG